MGKLSHLHSKVNKLHSPQPRRCVNIKWAILIFFLVPCSCSESTLAFSLFTLKLMNAGPWFYLRSCNSTGLFRRLGVHKGTWIWMSTILAIWLRLKYEAENSSEIHEHQFTWGRSWIKLWVWSQNSLDNFSFLTAFGGKPVKEHHLEISHLCAVDSISSGHTQSVRSINHQGTPGMEQRCEERRRQSFRRTPDLVFSTLLPIWLVNSFHCCSPRKDLGYSG